MTTKKTCTCDTKHAPRKAAAKKAKAASKSKPKPKGKKLPRPVTI